MVAPSGRELRLMICLLAEDVVAVPGFLCRGGAYITTAKVYHGQGGALVYLQLFKLASHLGTWAFGTRLCGCGEEHARCAVRLGVGRR